MFEDLQSIQWLGLSGVIAVLVVLFAVIVGIKYIKARRRGGKLEPDYRALVFLSIFFILAGLVSENTIILVWGLVFMATGLVNRDKWKNKSV